MTRQVMNVGKDLQNGPMTAEEQQRIARFKSGTAHPHPHPTAGEAGPQRSRILLDDDKFGCLEYLGIRPEKVFVP